MGFFSWCTSDTRKSIANCYADDGIIDSLGKDRKYVLMKIRRRGCLCTGRKMECTGQMQGC